jgi:RAD51-like protein 3
VVVQSEKVTLSSIRCYRALSLQTLFAVLEQLRRDMLALPRAADPLLRVVVIDSMSSLVAPQLGGSACGHAQMMQLVRTIKALAKRFQLVFLVTNHMVGGFRDDAEKPALGLSWTYAADTRLLLAPDREPGAAWASLTKSAKCATGARCLLRPSPCGMEPLQPPPPPPPPPPPR